MKTIRSGIVLRKSLELDYRKPNIDTTQRSLFDEQRRHRKIERFTEHFVFKGVSFLNFCHEKTKLLNYEVFVV